jgi:hypothetical protein
MRRLAIASVLVSLAAAAASSAQARRVRFEMRAPHCRLGAGEKPVLRNAAGVVSVRARVLAYAQHDATYSACLYRVQRRWLVGFVASEPATEGSTLSGFDLSGRDVTFVDSAWGRVSEAPGAPFETYLQSVTQRDLVTGRRTFEVTYGPEREARRPSLGEFPVANAAGDVAWTVQAGENCPWRKPCPGEAVIVHDRRGLRVVRAYPLATCPASPCETARIRGLRITAAAVLWSRGGESLSAPLR